MEFIDGRPLSDLIAAAKNKGEREALIRILAAVDRAVHHAHEQAIVHRDLKPGNVLINPGNDPIVLDFGLAKDVIADVGLTADDEIVGTPDFMSPEQVQGWLLDTRSDVFSLGSVCWTLLTVRAPRAVPSTRPAPSWPTPAAPSALMPGSR